MGTAHVPAAGPARSPGAARLLPLRALVCTRCAGLADALPRCGRVAACRAVCTAGGAHTTCVFAGRAGGATAAAARKVAAWAERAHLARRNRHRLRSAWAAVPQVELALAAERQDAAGELACHLHSPGPNLQQGSGWV